MKKYLIFPLALALTSGMALANSGNTLKEIQVPFDNQAVNSTDYEGLSVAYNMNNNPMQKVVCTLSNFYKGWIDYTENGALKESTPYGSTTTVTLTSQRQTQNIAENSDQYHADAQGLLIIHNTDTGNPSNALVSCSYMPEGVKNNSPYGNGDYDWFSIPIF